MTPTPWHAKCSRLNIARILAWCERNAIAPVVLDDRTDEWKVLDLRPVIEWYGSMLNTEKMHYFIFLNDPEDHMLLTLTWPQFYISPSSERA